MFEIKEEQFGQFKKLKIFNINTGEFVSIIPEFGGNTLEAAFVNKGKLYNILKGDSSYNKLIENKRFRGAKLVPFPNRVANGKYEFNGVDYQLPINEIDKNNSLHGLVFDKPMKIRHSSVNDKAGIIKTGFDYKGDIKGFPFKFNLEVEYKLTHEGLSIRTKVENTGKKKMPFGDGWHPYFRFNEPVDNLSLKIPSTTKICVNDGLIPTGDVLNDYNYSNFKKIGDDNLDAGYIINEKKNGKAMTHLYSSESDTTITLWQETGLDKYNYLIVYIPPGRKSIAIEPMTCTTNAFNNGKGLITLKPGESFHGNYGVYLS